MDYKPVIYSEILQRKFFYVIIIKKLNFILSKM
jgi:hypothetical protein